MFNEDIINLWTVDSDMNVVKTWLVGGTGGGTYSILDRFVPKIKVDDTKYEYEFSAIEMQIDEIIGYRHDYKIDDPELDDKARSIVDSLTDFVQEVNSNPEKFFAGIGTEVCICKNCIHCVACRKHKPDFSMDGNCDEFNLQK